MKLSCVGGLARVLQVFIDQWQRFYIIAMEHLRHVCLHFGGQFGKIYKAIKSQQYDIVEIVNIQRRLSRMSQIRKIKV